MTDTDRQRSKKNQTRPQNSIDIHQRIIVGGLILLSVIWLIYGAINLWQNGKNSEEELCKAFPDKCPLNSPFKE